MVARVSSDFGFRISSALGFRISDFASAAFVAASDTQINSFPFCTNAQRFAKAGWHHTISLPRVFSLVSSSLVFPSRRTLSV